MKIKGKFYSFFFVSHYLIYFKILLVQNLPLLKKNYHSSPPYFFSAVLERFPVKKEFHHNGYFSLISSFYSSRLFRKII